MLVLNSGISNIPVIIKAGGTCGEDDVIIGNVVAAFVFDAVPVLVDPLAVVLVGEGVSVVAPGCVVLTTDDVTVTALVVVGGLKVAAAVVVNVFVHRKVARQRSPKCVIISKQTTT